MLITDPIDFLLGSDGDLVFQNGDVVLSNGVEGIAQNIAIDLSIAIGEYFENREEGIPYFDNDLVPESQAILGGKFNAERIRAAFRQRLSSSFGVQDIIFTSVSFDSASRKITVSFNVQTIFGETGSQEVVING